LNCSPNLIKLITIIICTKLQQQTQRTAAECRHAAPITYDEQAYFNAGVHQHTAFHLNIY